MQSEAIGGGASFVMDLIGSTGRISMGRGRKGGGGRGRGLMTLQWTPQSRTSEIPPRTCANAGELTARCR